MSEHPARLSVLLQGMQEGSAAVAARALATSTVSTLHAVEERVHTGGVLLAGGVHDDQSLAVAKRLAADTERTLVLFDPAPGVHWALEDAAVQAAVVTRAERARAVSDHAPGLLWLRLPVPLDERALLAAMQVRSRHRAAMQSHLRLGTASTWLLGPGANASAATWHSLGRCAARAVDVPWCLIVTPAAGEATRHAEQALRVLPADRVRIWPEPSASDLLALVLSCELCLWPGEDDADLELLLLAQAAGLPAIASRGVASEECVRDSLTGRVLPAGNIESLANTLRFLLRHPAFASTLSRQAREAVTGEHGLAAVGGALAAFLRRWS